MKVERSPRRLLNALVPHVRDGFAAGYLRLRRWFGIVFGAVTDAKQRPGFPPDPPSARLELVAFSAW